MTKIDALFILRVKHRDAEGTLKTLWGYGGHSKHAEGALKMQRMSSESRRHPEGYDDTEDALGTTRASSQSFSKILLELKLVYRNPSFITLGTNTPFTYTTHSKQQIALPPGSLDACSD